jgi:peptidoglycan/xylan/chitin deacetylase (PgdA/CDA1 family)
MGVLGLTALLVVAGDMGDVATPTRTGLPGTAASPPSPPGEDDETPDLSGVAPDLEGPGGRLAPGHRAGTPATVLPTGPHLNVPVLMYHYIRVNPRPSDRTGFKLSVTPRSFAAQIALLRADGVHTVSLGDVVRALRGQGTLPSHPVVLTFDDGYVDFATTAAPLLAARGMTATAFVVSGFVGRPGYMSEDQVRRVQALGMTIGAHTVSHVDLTKLPPAIAQSQIEASRLSLQELTGEAVVDFAYPYGRHNRAVDRLVAEAGFRDAVTTACCDTQYLSLRFDMRRVAVTGYDTLAGFAAKARLPLPLPGTAAGIQGGPLRTAGGGAPTDPSDRPLRAA